AGVGLRISAANEAGGRCDGTGEPRATADHGVLPACRSNGGSRRPPMTILEHDRERWDPVFERALRDEGAHPSTCPTACCWARPPRRGLINAQECPLEPASQNGHRRTNARNAVNAAVR